MKHPEIVDKIRQEVQGVLFTGDNSGDDNDNGLDFARLTPVAMPYTMAVFYEGLRLFPPIPFEIKQVEAERLVLPDGTELNRGALVIWCSWALNRSHRTWGDDADEFRPERWLHAGGHRLVTRTASEFPVFHGGPRTCLGKKMAESMAVQTMATVAYFFDLELADPTAERVTKTSLTLPMEGGLPCYVRAREV
jgi:cytochrome P450